jgi:hypothetical protein
MSPDVLRRRLRFRVRRAVMPHVAALRAAEVHPDIRGDGGLHTIVLVALRAGREGGGSWGLLHAESLTRLR